MKKVNYFCSIVFIVVLHLFNMLHNYMIYDNCYTILYIYLLLYKLIKWWKIRKIRGYVQILTL